MGPAARSDLDELTSRRGGRSRSSGRTLGAVSRTAFFTFALSVLALAACADNRSRRYDDAGRPPPPVDGGPRADGGPLPGLDAAPGFDAFVPPADAFVPRVDGGPIDRCAGVDCSSLTTACATGTCDPGTGGCLAVPRSGSCEDGDLCTTGDFCSGGACQTGTPVDCSFLDDQCGVGECNPANGACRTVPVSDGTTCSGTGGGECSTSTCQAGACMSTPAADCSACSTGVCSAGTCGGAPSALVYDFEAGLPAGWTAGAAPSGWSVDASRAHAGLRAAHSGTIGHSATTALSRSFTLSGAGTLSFWLYTSTEPNYDFLELWVDGVRAQRWSGTTGWTQHTQALAAGTRLIEWRYTKDGSGAVGDDRVWIDDVRVEVSGATGESFELGTLPSGYTTSISPGWVVDTTLAHAGSYSMHSGTITHSQSSGVRRSVTLSSASSVSFWLSVSSESGYDFLRFYVDGIEQDNWSGTIPWTQAIFPLTAGTHTLEWRYTKDSSVTTGSDRAWVDEVQLGAASLCGS